MSEVTALKSIDTEALKRAMVSLGKYNLHARMRAVTNDEAHRILPEIWPVIQELCLISDACEAGVLQVKK